MGRCSAAGAWGLVAQFPARLETAVLAGNPLIFPDTEMRKRLVVARDITSAERLGFAKRWNAVVGVQL